tara:strand:+ start:886 stop:1203 length:318 start_codon:yes stop_codon:yes gene_type:complete
MFKNILFFVILISLSHCSTPGAALLGPTFTGFKTGSIYQSSLAYGSGKAMNIIKDKIYKEQFSSKGLLLPEVNENKISQNSSNLFVSIKTYKVEISEVFEEEPLP